MRHGGFEPRNDSYKALIFLTFLVFILITMITF
nr:MAG TPA: hypothetical protein [Caudoviricetes sp.]